MIELFNEDANKWMAGLKSNTVDLIVTDPPYSSLERHRAVGTTTRLKKWFPVEPDNYFLPWFYQAYRVLKENTHCYVFCKYDIAHVLEKYGEIAGFKFLKPIIWDKVHRGTGYPYANQFEMILLFSKGKRKTNTYKQRDVISVKNILKRDKYPTQKPIELLEIFITESSNKGEVVLDSFMGSGSTGEACLKHDRSFIGNDKYEVAFGRARRRLIENTLSWQTELFQ